MNILVTGGAGYIGSHTCVELLKAGCSVLLEKVRPGQGHSDMLSDLLDLIGIFQEEKNKEILAGRTPVEPSDLVRADTVAQRLQLVITPQGGASTARDSTGCC